MALTRDLIALVKQRVARDPAFRDALLRECFYMLLSNDVDIGNAILRGYIKAAVETERLAPP